MMVKQRAVFFIAGRLVILELVHCGGDNWAVRRTVNHGQPVMECEGSEALARSTWSWSLNDMRETIEQFQRLA
jgi:hypothetical protein